MSNNTTQLEPELPELPDADFMSGDCTIGESAYTASQMHAYALSAIAADRNKREGEKSAVHYSQKGKSDLIDEVVQALSAAPVAAGLSKLLVDVATAVMEERRLLSRLDDKDTQAFCEELDAEFARALSARLLPEGWVSVEDRMPELGETCFVWSKQPWEKEPSAKIDTWDEQHEAPVSFSSATIPVGPGWDEHDDFHSVTHWKRIVPPIAAAPSEVQAEPREEW